MFHVSLGNKIVMKLRETMATQWAYSSLLALIGNSTNFAGRCIWNNNLYIVSCCHFHLTCVLEKASWYFYFVFSALVIMHGPRIPEAKPWHWNSFPKMSVEFIALSNTEIQESICRIIIRVWFLIADHSGRAVWRWDSGFESHSRHGYLCVRLFCVCAVLYVSSGLATG
jgi:hypothetical protein